MIDSLDLLAIFTPDNNDLVLSILGPGSCFGLVDKDLNILFQSHQDALAHLSSILPLPKDTDSTKGVAAYLESTVLTDTLQRVYPIELEYLNIELYFIGIVKNSQENARKLHEQKSLFERIVHLIANMINLKLENDYMARDLSRRYDELNLVYQAEKQAKMVLSVRTTLDDTVKNIIEFMDVAAAFLFIPDMNIRVFHASPDTGIDGDDPDIKAWISEQLDRLKKEPSSLVVNPDQKAPFQLLLKKIIGTTGKQIGGIGCLRQKDRIDFELGDQSLLAVTAQQVQKVVLKHIDNLTGLVNRVGFEDHLAQMITSGISQAAPISVVFINIDNFKLLNDAYGMAEGDMILKQLARVLEGHVRRKDLLARTEGDVFSIIFALPISKNQCIAALKRIKDGIESCGFKIGDKPLTLTVSMGVIIITEPLTHLTEIFSMGEIALREAKKKGGSCIAFSGENDAAVKQVQTEALYATQIETLIQDNRFLLYSQPIVPLSGARPHYENLIRLRGENGNVVAPYQFLPAAEKYNKMTLIDKWVLEETCRLLDDYKDTLKDLQITWSVNLSSQSLQEKAFFDYFVSYLSQLPFPPEWLCFEVTETVAIQNFDQVSKMINKVKDMGHAFALDDFGTGYSSFAYLKRLPVSYLKIDGAFVKQLDKDGFDQVMVQSIVAIAKHLKIKTIAEFVENDEILSCLKAFHVDYSQGYHTGKPRDMIETLESLKTKQIESTKDEQKKNT